MTKKLLKISMTKLEADRRKSLKKEDSVIEFIVKHGIKLGHPVNALDLARKFCGRG